MRIDPRRIVVAFVVLMAPVLAFAQSMTGSIYGQTRAGASAVVIIKNAGTGATRETTAASDGSFSFSTVAPGTYAVSVKEGGNESPARQVVVVAGIGSPVNFEGAASDATKLDTLVVGGSVVTPIDVSTAQTSMVYSAQRMEQIPVAKDIVSVALLAPGTTRGDSAFGNLASFGGASVAENSYYVNGFNVTNLFKNLAYAQVPFYAISEEQVVTGSYGAEYGLATGGVVNLTTMKGTNTWTVGGAATYEPDQLREKSPKTFTNSFAAYRDYSQTDKTLQTYDVWAGGPLLRNTLFGYAIVEVTQINQNFEPRTYDKVANYEALSQNNPFGLANVSWNINDSNILGFTYINDTRKQKFGEFGVTADGEGFLKNNGKYLGTDHFTEGGNIFIGNYTGYLTDSMTLTVQAGTLKSKRGEYQNAANGTRISYNGNVGDFNQPGCPLVLYNAAWRAAPANSATATPSCQLTNTVEGEGSQDHRTAGRADLEYRLEPQFVGTHTLKGGVELDRWSSKDGATYSGGTYYRYQRTAGQNAVRVRHFQTGAKIDVNTTAFYLQDKWQPRQDLLITAGVRDDSFENLNGAGVAYVKEKNIIEPRLGASWDVKGDSTQKVYGTWGIYSLPIAATVAVRGASASIFSEEVRSYTAIDPVTGAPTLGAPVACANCAFHYLNGEDGTTPDPNSVASKGLDPTIQHEYVLGYQTLVGDGWTAGIRGTYRNLETTIDDMCDDRPFIAWAADNGYVFAPTVDVEGCHLFNPGKAMDISADVDGDGVKENVHLTPAMIGEPAVKRRYSALEFTAEKTTSLWFTQASYTWAHNYGNAEGLVQSNIGQDDTGTTEDFDFPELMKNATGDLPNDRRHTFKATGGYKLVEEVAVSMGVLLQSGRPQNCIGTDPANDYEGYGVAFYRCGGKAVPRGTAGTNPWVFSLDLGASYRPHYLAGLSLQAKVFNVLNNAGITQIDEAGEDSSGIARAAYKTPRSYQTPRFFQFTARYDFSL